MNRRNFLTAIFAIPAIAATSKSSLVETMATSPTPHWHTWPVDEIDGLIVKYKTGMGIPERLYQNQWEGPIPYWDGNGYCLDFVCEPGLPSIPK